MGGKPKFQHKLCEWLGTRNLAVLGGLPRADHCARPSRSPRWGAAAVDCSCQCGVRRLLSSSVAPDPGPSVRASEYTLTLGPPGGWGALALRAAAACAPNPRQGRSAEDLPPPTATQVQRLV